MSPEPLSPHMASVQIERLRREVAEERRRREMAEAALEKAQTLLRKLVYHESVAPRTWAEPTPEDLTSSRTRVPTSVARLDCA
jgi:hypothetical protein